MADGIDLSKRKPRRLRGTPALKFLNRLAFGVLGFSALSVVLLSYIPSFNRVTELTHKHLSSREEDDYDKALFVSSLIERKTGDQLREEVKKFETEAKQY